MKKDCSVLKVRINLDPIPGWGNHPEDHIKMVQQFLNTSIPHYKPEVTLIRVEDRDSSTDCSDCERGEIIKKICIRDPTSPLTMNEEMKFKGYCSVCTRYGLVGDFYEKKKKGIKDV